MQYPGAKSASRVQFPAETGTWRGRVAALMKGMAKLRRGRRVEYMVREVVLWWCLKEGRSFDLGLEGLGNDGDHRYPQCRWF